MSKYKDTIYALSTPTGKSAIAVIRISGKQSLNILKKIFTLCSPLVVEAHHRMRFK